MFRTQETFETATVTISQSQFRTYLRNWGIHEKHFRHVVNLLPLLVRNEIFPQSIQLFLTCVRFVRSFFQSAFVAVISQCLDEVAGTKVKWPRTHITIDVLIWLTNMINSNGDIIFACKPCAMRLHFQSVLHAVLSGSVGHRVIAPTFFTSSIVAQYVIKFST